MMRSGLTLGVMWAFVGPAVAAPANTINEMYMELNRCGARIIVAAGTDVTLQFMVNRKGGVIGKPRVTHAVWPPNADPRETAAAIAAGFDRCLPIAITDALGAAIAGRLITYRLRATPPQEKT